MSEHYPSNQQPMQTPPPELNQPQQPGYSFQPPQGPYAPPQQQPHAQKKSRTGLWIALAVFLVVLVVACSLASMAASSASRIVTTTTAATTDASTAPASTNTGKWTTTHSFSGHTHNKTPFFTVKKGWRLIWECTNSTVGPSATGSVLIISYGKNGQALSGNDSDPALTMGECPVLPSKTSGTSDVQEYGGSMRLDVFITGDWGIHVQELK